MVAVATLRQGLPAETASKTLAQEADALGYELRDGPAALCNALTTALPDGAGGLAAIGPDMVGEALLLSVWKGGAEVLPAIGRAHAVEPVATMETVIRACQDYAIRGHRAPLDWLRHIYDARTNLTELMELANAMPRHTSELRGIALEITHAIADLIGPMARKTMDPNKLAIFAMSLNNLSNRLLAAGRPKEALTAIEVAEGVYRNMADEWPDRFRPELATSLHNSSACLSTVGRPRDAVAKAEEAVAICSDLADARPDAYQPDLADSLHNLSLCLSEAGMRKEALAVLQKAVGIWRSLVRSRPDDFRPPLAKSLHNLSIQLSELNRPRDALTAAEEAVSIRRDLAATHPDAYRPNLAGSLRSLSVCLAAAGRKEEALTAAEEAMEALREPFLATSAAFCSEMVAMVTNYRLRCDECGREADFDLLAPIAEAFERLQDRFAHGK